MFTGREWQATASLHPSLGQPGPDAPAWGWVPGTRPNPDRRIRPPRASRRSWTLAISGRPGPPCLRPGEPVEPFRPARRPFPQPLLSRSSAACPESAASGVASGASWVEAAMAGPANRMATARKRSGSPPYAVALIRARIDRVSLSERNGHRGRPASDSRSFRTRKCSSKPPVTPASAPSLGRILC